MLHSDTVIMGLRDALPRRGWAVISATLLLNTGLYFVPHSEIGIQPQLFIIGIVLLQGILALVIVSTFLYYHDETTKNASKWRYNP